MIQADPVYVREHSARPDLGASSPSGRPRLRDGRRLPQRRHTELERYRHARYIAGCRCSAAEAEAPSAAGGRRASPRRRAVVDLRRSRRGRADICRISRPGSAPEHHRPCSLPWSTRCRAGIVGDSQRVRGGARLRLPELRDDGLGDRHRGRRGWRRSFLGASADCFYTPRGYARAVRRSATLRVATRRSRALFDTKTQEDGDLPPRIGYRGGHVREASPRALRGCHGVCRKARGAAVATRTAPVAERLVQRVRRRAEDREPREGSHRRGRRSGPPTRRGRGSPPALRRASRGGDRRGRRSSCGSSGDGDEREPDRHRERDRDERAGQAARRSHCPAPRRPRRR